jgi:hypothetical protein
MLAFFGLILTGEDKVRIHQELFHLIYNSQGGFTHDEAYSLPISLRYFYLRMLIEQREKENSQAKHQENQSSPKSKPVARPPSVRK